MRDFVLCKLAVGSFILYVNVDFSLVNISSVLRGHISFIYHRRYIIVAIDILHA